jgi:outer membrane protein assembly factor BamB
MKRLQNLFGRRAAGILGAMVCLGLTAADWPQFRGADNASVTAGRGLPVRWEVADAAGSVAFPGRGVSGPVVIGDQVITTSSSGQKNERLHIWSVDTATGAARWQRSLWATGRTFCHPLTSMAAPTPATDGSRVYVLFASNDLVCLDLEGNVLWVRALGAEHPQSFDDRGLGSSPLLVDGMLVLQIECHGDSFATGIDCLTGGTRWRMELPQSVNWLSPATLVAGSKRLAVLQTTDRLLILEPSDGTVRAEYQTPGSSIASPVARDGVIYMPSKGLTALRYLPESDEPDFLWQTSRLGAQSSSPVVADGKLFVIRSPNILACGDAGTGDELWRVRLEGSRYWATPVLAGDHLYCVSEDGIVHVIDVAGTEGEILAKNAMSEEILGSPAICDGAIYVRGVTHLWKIGGGTVASSTSDGSPQND